MAVAFLVLLLLVFLVIAYVVVSDRGFLSLLVQICGLLGLVAVIAIVTSLTFRRSRKGDMNHGVRVQH